MQHEGIVTTYRNTGIRVAPHGYNTPAEIDALIDAVGRQRKEQVCSR
jgi:selenocysteine lyase/cysteine desulfurase